MISEKSYWDVVELRVMNTPAFWYVQGTNVLCSFKTSTDNFLGAKSVLHNSAARTKCEVCCFPKKFERPHTRTKHKDKDDQSEHWFSSKVVAKLVPIQAA